MTALTIAKRQERTRLQIVDALKHHHDMTAGQLTYELGVYGLRLTPAKLAHLIKGDERLQKQVSVEARRIRGSWALAYSLKARWGGD